MAVRAVPATGAARTANFMFALDRNQFIHPALASVTDVVSMRRLDSLMCAPSLLTVYPLVPNPLAVVWLGHSRPPYR